MHALGASLEAVGAGVSPPATGARVFTPAELQMVYHAGMQRCESRLAHSYCATTMALRGAVTAELDRFLACIPPHFGITVHTMQPTDVVVFMTMAWLPKHGRTVLSTGEVCPAAMSIRSVTPAMDYVFARSRCAREYPWHGLPVVAVVM